jgi:hypothetical protein
MDKRIVVCYNRHQHDKPSCHYVKTSNRSRNICNGPLIPVTCTHICNCCYFAPVTDKRGRPSQELVSATPVTDVDFW